MNLLATNSNDILAALTGSKNVKLRCDLRQIYLSFSILLQNVLTIVAFLFQRSNAIPNRSPFHSDDGKLYIFFVLIIQTIVHVIKYSIVLDNRFFSKTGLSYPEISNPYLKIY